MESITSVIAGEPSNQSLKMPGMEKPTSENQNTGSPRNSTRVEAGSTSLPTTDSKSIQSKNRQTELISALLQVRQTGRSLTLLALDLPIETCMENIQEAVSHLTWAARAIQKEINKNE